MNHNVGIRNPGLIAWNGAAAFPRDITKFLHFGFTFEVVAAVAVDAVFNIVSHPGTLADPCVPGAASPVPEVALCDGAEAGPQATVTIPAGTPIGTICSGTIPCFPDKFVSLAAASGTVASIRAVMVFNGPMV